MAKRRWQLIRKYVESGGGLVATEQTSIYDEWRRRRENFGLRDIFGIDAPKYRENLYTFRPYPGVNPGAGMPRQASAAPAAPAPVRRNFGRGRSAYIPQVRPAVAKPAGAAMTSEYWKLPVNWQQIVDEVRWAANGFSLEVKGPPALVAEPLDQPGTGRVLIHLINYDERRPAPENIAVSLRIPAGKTVRAVRLASPDAAGTPTLAHTVTGGRAAFTVPRVRTYSVAIVELR